MSANSNNVSPSISRGIRNSSGTAHDQRRGPVAAVVERSQPVGVSRQTVQRTLALYREELEKLSREKEGPKTTLPTVVANLFQKHQRCLNATKRIGHVSGINVSDRFQYRAELFIIGLHRQRSNGIDFKRGENGQNLAISIVASGCYDNDMSSPDEVVYCGQGGNPTVSSRIVDQRWTGGNLALRNSIGARNPVRVIHGFKYSKPSPTDGTKSGYVYDGLYYVKEWRQVRGKFGKLVFKFTLKRIIE
ncbi:histone-lysine N-methyltransferase, H3 lysine-9 specific SUVH5-like [Tripterygium wilfordii]|uniref:histone-lysine N-methyltransferase, H3 lysine-9 specific SUVH5-like n=1 Tax=Tripterygium wilfordii TaxID=458696 RepID=UPI0018F8453B|nr:histone-lysine N-methyltransferase, H3 lysine-9 specific SUVH5-like [Tripterygium wilfordii]XP_038687177.1 histone-lysine N-methyltransferase, H3 lysine-9 specific SUVH5-like [Tripterygium wilfordii]